MVSSGASRVGGASVSSRELEDLFESCKLLQHKQEKVMEDHSTEGKPSSTVPTLKKIKWVNVKACDILLDMDPLADKDHSYWRG